MRVGTYSQIYVQLVFAVKGRKSLIHPVWEQRLYRYLKVMVSYKECKLLAINGTPDHVHLLVSLRLFCSLSDLVRELKKSSNRFINENKLTPQKFEWQEGYGAFSHGYESIDRVKKSIKNQKKYHRRSFFRDEYKYFLDKFDVKYEEKFLFEWIK